MTAPDRTCRECDLRLRHCHAPWVAHRDGSGECTDAGCTTPVEGHGDVVRCADAACCGD